MPESQQTNYDSYHKTTIANRLDDVLSPAERDMAGSPADAAPAVPQGGGVLGRFRRSKINRAALRAALTDDAKPGIDLSPLLEKGDADFLCEAVRLLFYREIGPGEYPLLQQVIAGMPREAALYILCASPEMDRDCMVEHFGQYEKAYLRNKVARRIARVPVINYIVALFYAPMRLKRINETMAKNEVARFHDTLEAEKFIRHRTDLILDRLDEMEGKPGNRAAKAGRKQ